MKTLGEKNFFISRVKTSLKLYKAASIKCNIYDLIDTKKLLVSSGETIDQDVYIGSTQSARLKVRLVGKKLPDKVASIRIKKALFL